MSVSVFQIDIRDYDALYKISAGVDVIFHTASYGMSGPEQVSVCNVHLMRARSVLESTKTLRLMHGNIT